MAICGLSLHQGSTESRKTLEQNLFFKSALFLTVPTSASHSTNLCSCFSRYHGPTNSIASFFLFKPHTTHNSSIRSDEGPTLETSAFESLYGGQFTLSTQLIKPNAAPQFLWKLIPFIKKYLLRVRLATLRKLFNFSLRLNWRIGLSVACLRFH